MALEDGGQNIENYGFKLKKGLTDEYILVDR